MEYETCPVTFRIPLMKLHVVPEDNIVTANRANNKATSRETDHGGSMSPGTRHTTTALKEKEPSKQAICVFYRTQ